MKTFQSIKYWIFDLDNTLYSGKTRVFEQVEKRMSKYVSDKLNISIDKAKKIQKNYFHKYNTTLNGMIKNHKIDANEFLEFVHDINIDFLKKVGQQWSNDDLDGAQRLSKFKSNNIELTEGQFQRFKEVLKPVEDRWLKQVSFLGIDGKKLIKKARQTIRKHSN